MRRFVSRRRLLGIASGLSFGWLAPGVAAADDGGAAASAPSSAPITVAVLAGVAVSAESTSTTPGDHDAVVNLVADGGAYNAALNLVSANTAFSAAEVSGHETGHGTLKISHVNPGPDPASDANAAAIGVDLRAGTAGGTSAQGIVSTSTTGGIAGKIINSVDPTGATLFALLSDGALLLRPVASAPGSGRWVEVVQRRRRPRHRGCHRHLHGAHPRARLARYGSFPRIRCMSSLVNARNVSLRALPSFASWSANAM